MLQWHLCEPFISGPAGLPAERLKELGLVCPDRSPGGTACRRVPETWGNPIKISFFPLCVLESFLGYDTREKSENKADFPCSLQENENEKWRMGGGSSRPFAQKKERIRFRGRTIYLTLLFKSAKIKKVFTKAKEKGRPIDLNVLI